MKNFFNKFKKKESISIKEHNAEVEFAKQEERKYSGLASKRLTDLANSSNNKSNRDSHWEEFSVYKRDRTYENTIFDEGIFKKDKDSKTVVVIKKVLESISGGFITFRSGSGFGLKRPLSDEELFTIQSAVFDKVQKNPIAQAIVNNITWYVIGEGTRIECQVPEIKKVITDFRKLNKMNEKEKAMVRSTFMDGEYFALLILGNNGELLMRKIHTHEITDIEFQDDVDNPLAFERTIFKEEGRRAKNKEATWYPSIDYYTQLRKPWGNRSSNVPSTFKKAKRFVYYMKYGEEGEIRARPPMLSILKPLTYYDEFQEDRMIKQHETARVVWIVKTPQDANVNTENPLNKGLIAPPGGGMLVESNGREYRVLI